MIPLFLLPQSLSENTHIPLAIARFLPSPDLERSRSPQFRVLSEPEVLARADWHFCCRADRHDRVEPPRGSNRRHGSNPVPGDAR